MTHYRMTGESGRRQSRSKVFFSASLLLLIPFLIKCLAQMSTEYERGARRRGGLQ